MPEDEKDLVTSVTVAIIITMPTYFVVEQYNTKGSGINFGHLKSSNKQDACDLAQQYARKIRNEQYEDGSYNRSHERSII